MSEDEVIDDEMIDPEDGVSFDEDLDMAYDDDLMADDGDMESNFNEIE